MKKSSKKGSHNKLDFNFCFPYLASLNDLALKKMSPATSHPLTKKEYSSLKQSEKRIIKAYHPQSLPKKGTSERKIIMNCCLGPSRVYLPDQNGQKSVSYCRKRSVNSCGKKRKTNFIEKNREELTSKNSKLQTKSLATLEIQNYNTELSAPTAKRQQEQQVQVMEFALSEPKEPKFEIAGVVFRDRGKRRIFSAHSSKVGRPDDDGFCERKISRQELWQKQRRQNIDTIIRMNCTSFAETMLEFYKRSNPQAPSQIYLFDSNDTWMKKVLNKRGWTENKNKGSRAYHLYWGYKFPKELPFPEQRVNHYPESHKITSKGELHQLVRKYQVEHIQPQTYDLDSEQQQFKLQYDKFMERSEIEEQVGREVETEQLIKKRGQSSREQISPDYLVAECLNCDPSNCQTDEANIPGAFERSQSQKGDSLLQQQKRNSVDIPELKDSRNSNIWIVKSKNSSKSAGTFLSSSKTIILKQQNRIVQKYIENTLLLKSAQLRKFDIRLWLLVVGATHNTRIYYFKDFYCRLCSEPYSTTQSSLKQEQVHLTNYANNKNNFQEKGQSVLFPDQLFASVNSEHSIDFEPLFYTKVQTLLKNLIPMFRYQLCQQQCYLNYFQLFGVDVLLDDNLNLYLLEINLSARCQERHSRLSSMLENMGEGILNILDDRTDINRWVPLI